MQNLLRRVAKTLDKIGIDYMIIGGQAVLIYGEPRLTRDIDITLLAQPNQLTKVMKVVKDLALEVLVENVEDFVHSTRVFTYLRP